MQLELELTPTVELFCPNCCDDNVFQKNEEFTKSDNYWVVTCRDCNFPVFVEIEKETPHET